MGIGFIRLPNALHTTLYDQVWQSLAANAEGPWFSIATVSSTNKTDHHDITEKGVKHHNAKPITMMCNIDAVLHLNVRDMDLP